MSVRSLGDLAGDDALGEALDDRGLADARLTDEHRVVLRATRQDLHDALDLARTPDDRVEVALACGLRQVAPELVEDRGPVTRAAGRALAHASAGLRTLATGVAGEQLDDLLAHAVEVRTELLQHLRGDTVALTDQPEEDVLGADVVVSELQRLTQGELEDLLRTRGERDVPGRSGLAATDDLADLLADVLERHVHRLERLRGDALTLVDQSEKDVLRPDVVVVEHPRLFLGEDHDPAGPVGEPLEHRAAFSSSGPSVTHASVGAPGRKGRNRCRRGRRTLF